MAIVSKEKFYPTNERGQDDDGAADRRREFCSKDAWCVLTTGHKGSCRTTRKVVEARPIRKLVIIDKAKER